MKIDLTCGRRAKSEVLERRFNQFMALMELGVRPEDVKCEVKVLFKTFSSFHLVTARGDGSKAACSCPGYFSEMVCEHTVLLDMLCDVSFQISDKYVEECAEFRRRAGRRRGLQRQVDAGSR